MKTNLLDISQNLLLDYDPEAPPLPSPLCQNEASLKNKEAALRIHNVNTVHKVPPAACPTTSAALFMLGKTSSPADSSKSKNNAPVPVDPPFSPVILTSPSTKNFTNQEKAQSGP